MRPKSAPENNREAPSVPAFAEELVVPIVEEVAYVDKRVVEAGRVRVAKKVTETEQVFDEPMLREEVTVERVPMNQYVDIAPQVRYDGDMMIIPVVEEQYVMQKRLVLVEEIRLRKERVEIHQPQKIRLRKEKVEVSRVAGEPPPRRKK